MAKVKFSQLIETIRGRIKNLVIRQRPDGTFILSGKPRYKKGKGSPAQKAHRRHVKQIGPFASYLAKTHPIYAQLAAEDVARGKWMSAYNFAFADCLKPPIIHRIERTEGCIRVEASDNIMVTEVEVTILDEAGKLLEIGDAIQAEGDWWEYVPHAEGKGILAKAFDLPGNCARLEL